MEFYCNWICNFAHCSVSQSWSCCLTNGKEIACCAQQANCSVDQRLNCSAHYWHVCFSFLFLCQVAFVFSGSAYAFWKQKLAGQLHIFVLFGRIKYWGSRNEMRCLYQLAQRIFSRSKMRGARCEKTNPITKADVVPLCFGWVLCWVFFSSPAFSLSLDFQKSIHLRTGIKLYFYFSKQTRCAEAIKGCCWQIFVRVWSCTMRREKVEWLENYNKYFLKGGKIARSTIPMATLKLYVLSWGARGLLIKSE